MHRVRFDEELGFTLVLDGEVAIFRIGSSSFVLQWYFQKHWAENFMMQLTVRITPHLVVAHRLADLPRNF